MNRWLYTGRITLFLTALILFGSPACAQVILKLCDIAFIAGERATLGDIAELSGNPETLARLKSLPAGLVIESGQMQTITVRDLVRMIPSDVAVQCRGAESVEIAPWTGSVEFHDLLPSIQRRYEALAGDSIDVFINNADSQKWFCEAQSPPLCFSFLGSDRFLPGSQVISLECRDGSGKIRRYHFNLEIALFARLPYPGQRIKRGQKIKPDDIILKTVNLKSTGLSGLVYHPESLMGLEAARHLSPGSPIRWDQVCRPPAVRQGSEVEVVLGSKNFSVKTSALALQTGSPGDEIWVRLEGNGMRLRAVVVDADRVSLK